MHDTDTQRNFVLIADGNIDDRFRTGMILQELGYSSFPVSDAEIALNVMRATPPAAVLADAGEVGMAILECIKKEECIVNVPLILLSATPNGMLEGRARRGVIAGFLRKPVDAKSLALAMAAPFIQETQRRSKTSLSQAAHVRGADFTAAGLVTVLSENGMFIRTLDPRPLHDRVQVQIVIGIRPMTLDAEVVSSCNLDGEPFKEPGMTVSVLKIVAGDQAVIKAFVRGAAGAGAGLQAVPGGPRGALQRCGRPLQEGRS